MSAPFDPIATKKAERLGLKVLFAKGSDLDQVKKIFAGKKFKGTIIA
jgi:uridylate kinase